MYRVATAYEQFTFPTVPESQHFTGVSSILACISKPSLHKSSQNLICKQAKKALLSLFTFNKAECTILNMPAWLDQLHGWTSSMDDTRHPGRWTLTYITALHNLYFEFLKYFCVCVCIIRGIQPPQNACQGQRTTCGTQFSLSTTWVPETELRSWNTFPHGSPACI